MQSPRVLTEQLKFIQFDTPSPLIQPGCLNKNKNKKINEREKINIMPSILNYYIAISMSTAKCKGITVLKLKDLIAWILRSHDKNHFLYI